MKTHFYARKMPYSKHIFIFLFSLLISLPAVANQDDWVMVDRFKRQLVEAKAGKIKAMYSVGKLYERGRGTDLNLKLAAEWYQKAANAGQSYAQSRLGIMYFEGRGVKQDYNKALKLLNTAAKANVPSAQYQLANMYELGTGVPQDLKKAIHWYNESDKYGYYLAKAKVKRLKKIVGSKSTVSTSNITTSKPAAKKKKGPPSKLIRIISKGQWFKRKKAVGYLPSIISNCVNESHNTLHCISTSQERSTGSEIITYNTESNITVKNKNSFNVVYSNNVLDVTTLEAEDGDGEVIEETTSRIKEGKQGKKRTLNCKVKDTNVLTCSKGSSSFELISR